MTFASERVAKWLATELAPALPERAGVTLSAQGPRLRVEHRDAATEIDLARFGQDGVLDDPAAETATRAALATVQDAVIYALTEPWPAPEAMPDATRRGELLIAWYGAPEAPALRLGGLSPG